VCRKFARVQARTKLRPGPIVAGSQGLDAGPAAWWIVTAGHRGPWRHRGAGALVDRHRWSSRAVASIVGSQVRTAAPAAWWIVTAAIEGRGVNAGPAAWWIVAGSRGLDGDPRAGVDRRGPQRHRGVNARPAAPALRPQ
jgi:hypothetical protein